MKNLWIFGASVVWIFHSAAAFPPRKSVQCLAEIWSVGALGPSVKHPISVIDRLTNFRVSRLRQGVINPARDPVYGSWESSTAVRERVAARIRGIEYDYRTLGAKRNPDSAISIHELVGVEAIRDFQAKVRSQVKRIQEEQSSVRTMTVTAVGLANISTFAVTYAVGQASGWSAYGLLGFLALTDGVTAIAPPLRWLSTLDYSLRATRSQTESLLSEPELDDWVFRSDSALFFGAAFEGSQNGEKEIGHPRPQFLMDLSPISSDDSVPVDVDRLLDVTPQGQPRLTIVVRWGITDNFNEATPRGHHRRRGRFESHIPYRDEIAHWLWKPHTDVTP